MGIIKIKDMSKFFATDYRSIDTFKRYNYEYTKVSQDEKWMVWRLSKNGEYRGYELWKRIRHRNPDGTEVWIAPSDEQFGRYGWYIYYLDDEVCFKRIEQLKRMSEERENTAEECDQ